MIKNKYQMLVFCENENGEADIFGCVVEATEDQMSVGAHYDIAEKMAIEKGYEPKMSADEFEPAFKMVNYKWD
jgi:hypothetical protein